jgi:rifampin ADP-ribosylating transferase
MTYAINATRPFYHGTRADLAPGDLLTPGNRSNYADRKLSWIYFSGAFEDDPNLTDKRFPGNPAQSYRSPELLRVVGEVET